MRAGVHISIRDGFLAAAKTAKRFETTAFQYFPKNPRSLVIKQLDIRDAHACAKYCDEHRIVSVAHTPYPTNLALGKEEADRVAKSLLNDLMIAESCGSLGVVVHFGKYRGDDLLQGYQNIIACINKVLAAWTGQALLLLENESGQGTGLGTTLEESVHIRQLCERPEMIGFCLDTCHAFASGEWTKSAESSWEQRLRETGYMEHVQVIHLNDSVFPAGSRRDRHANFGKGSIGQQRWTNFLSMKELQSLPIILETPGSKTGSYKEELVEINQLLS